MADRPETPPHANPRLGWCLALYPRLSHRARRRLAALVVAGVLVAQPLAGHAQREGSQARGGFGGNFPPLAQLAPARGPGASGAADPRASSAVARALRALGLDAPSRPQAPGALDATPAGSEFQVNTYTTNDQANPAVAMDADGDFVVVWDSLGSGGTDTSRRSIQGQRYDSAGMAVGSQFQVNSYTTDFQSQPSVAMDADGDFVVVWESSGSGGTDTSSDSIHGQRYDSAGMAVGSQFQVNSYTTGQQNQPSVAMDADGDFVVVWRSDGSAGTDADGNSIQGQRYDSAGMAVGSQFQVNSYTTSGQSDPSVALDADGDFVVVWHSSGSSGTDTSGYSVQAQRYDSAGAAMGPVPGQRLHLCHSARAFCSDGRGWRLRSGVAQLRLGRHGYER